MLCLLLASTPAAAVVLEVEATDPVEDVVDTGTGGEVFEPSLDILSVRTDGDATSLEVIMALNGTFHEEASYTVNLLVDGEDTFTLLWSPYSGFTGSGPLGEVLNVTGRFEGSLVVWRLVTPELSVGTALAIEFATASRVDGTGALLLDTLEPDASGNEQPTVAIRLPAWGYTVTGTYVASGTAADDSGVTGVVVRIDEGEWAMASGTGEWTYAIDSTSLDDGMHTLEARSYDGVLQSEVDRVAFVVANGEADNEAPVVDVNFPTARDTVNGIINVTGRAWDDSSVDRVEVRFPGGEWMLATGTDTWRMEVDTRPLEEGTHHMEVVAYDDQGLVSRMSGITLNVDRGAPTGNLPPVITIDPLENGSLVPRDRETPFQPTGQCHDDTARTVALEYRVDGGEWTPSGWVYTYWSLEIDVWHLEGGVVHTLEVRVFDIVQYSAIARLEFDLEPNRAPTLTISRFEEEEDFFNISGEASDEAEGVTRIEVRLNKNPWYVVWEGQETDSEWGTKYYFNDLAPLTNYTFSARSFDGELYSKERWWNFTSPKHKGGINPKPFPCTSSAMGLLVLVMVVGERGRRRLP